MTNIEAAIGVAQLEVLPQYNQTKKVNYEIYNKAIKDIPGLCLAETPNYANSNYWFYCLQIDKAKYGKDREALMAHFADNKIETRPIWYLNHLQKPYRNYQSYKIENALKMLEITLNIPCSVNLKEDQLTRVVNTLK